MLSFFIGKGGVGKTTVASSYAVNFAARHPRQPVLLISTDPAHSLLDVFQIETQSAEHFSRPRAVRVPRGQLFLWQIAAQQEFDNFLAKYRDAILGVVEQGTLFSRGEIEPLLSTALPGMAEFAALLAIARALGLETGKRSRAGTRFPHVIVDTAPFGHTIRLFEMPEHFRRFLNFLDLAGSRDRVLAAHFGGGEAASQPFLMQWQRILDAVRDALGARDSRIVLVTTPESFSLKEAVRVARQLREGPAHLHVTEVVLNRSVAKAAGCPECAQRARQTSGARRFISRHFARVPLHLAGDSGAPILGAAALNRFGAHIFDRKPLPAGVAPPVSAQDISSQKISWPKLHAPLTLTLGKGGVGKTTISAGLAFHQRRAQPAAPVVICSTDPAPSLDDIFKQDIGHTLAPVLRDRKLQAAEFNAVAEFRAWAAHVKENIDGAFSAETGIGVHVDLSFERRIFSALLEIVPPGVDELFAVFRILDLLDSPNRRARVVIDMAPTGHALELLRMPERMLVWSRLLLKLLAAHRSLPLAQDAAVEIARVSQRVRQLAGMLKDPKQSQLSVVMLPEPLPDRETARLLRELKTMATPPPAIFVNRVMLDPSRVCTRCRLAREWQLSTLARLRMKTPFYLVRDFRKELAGRSGLQSLTRELWRLEPVRQTAGTRGRKKPPRRTR